MRLAIIIWIALLSISQAYTPDICAKKSFGYKAVDSKDPKSYFLCLGLLGKVWSHCDDGYRFNGPGQKCMIDKQISARANDAGGPDNVFNINQNISMYKPIIFNIFGSLWKPSKPRPPKPDPITPQPPISTESTTVSSSSTTTDSSTESSSSTSAASSTESSYSSSSTESSSSSSTVSSTESSSSSSTASSTESSSSSSAASSTESSSSSSTESSSTTDSTTPCTQTTDTS